MSSRTLDTVIIGAGIGGLTCGALLAKHGQRVLILEQHNKPGGYCTSFVRKGFRFDVPTIIGGFGPDDPAEMITSHLGIRDSLDLIRMDRFYRFIRPDLTVDLWSDKAVFEDALAARFPRERKGLRRYFDLSRRVWQETGRLDYAPGMPRKASYPFRLPTLFRLRNTTYRQVLDSLFQDDDIKEVFGCLWPFVGLPSDRVSAIYTIITYMHYHMGGAFYPRGGYGRMATVFADAVRGFGGELHLNAQVHRIVVEAGKAKAVEMTDGTVIPARCVVSNADIKRTFAELVGGDGTQRALARRVDRIKPSISCLSVHVGTRANIPQEFNCGHVLYYPEPGAGQRQFALAERGEMNLDPATLMLGITATTLRDPSAAPAGCHSVELTYWAAPANYRNRWGSADRKTYEELKAEAAQTIIGSAERLLPGLSKGIVVQDVSTPLTYERYTGATGGCIYDAAASPDQVCLNRMGPRTPIEGLYLTGAKSFPGHGILGAMWSGLCTADCILRGHLTGGGLRLRKGL